MISILTLRAIARQPETVRLGYVAIAPGRLRELLRHVPASSEADLSPDATRLRIMWHEPPRRGRLVLLRLAPTWIDRHPAVVQPLAEALAHHAYRLRMHPGASLPETCLRSCYGRPELHARAALCKRLDRAWKYVEGWTVAAALAWLRDADRAEVLDLPDASGW